MIVLYNILLVMLLMIGFPFIIPMILLSDKRRQTLLPRLGLTSFPDVPTSRKPIWVHALSVGETLSAVPLVEKLRERVGETPIIFSASTQTGFDIAKKRLKPYVDGLFYFPYDLLLSVRHMVRKADPAMVVMVETDIWPNFLSELERRHVPVILVNARLSKKSFRGYRRLSFFGQSLFSTFSKVCAQTIEDARRFRMLGVPPESVIITGNVKFDQPDDPVSDAEIESLRHALKIDPHHRTILAGSTHKGEEAVLSDAFLRMRRAHDDLLMIVVPRDPARAHSVCRLFGDAGLSVHTLSALSQHPDQKMDVIVIDVIGLLRRLYAVADVAFVGGSLVRLGGHNPLEPAIFSKPILFGPDMSDFAEISGMLLKAGGAVQVRDATSFCEVATHFLADEETARKAGERAFQVFHTNRGAVERTLDVIFAYVNQVCEFVSLMSW